MVGAIGLLLGLAVAVLLAFAVSPLPYVGRYVLLPLFLVLGYVFAIVGARRGRAILRLVGINPGRALRVAHGRRPRERDRSSSTPPRSSTAASPTSSPPASSTASS